MQHTDNRPTWLKLFQAHWVGIGFGVWIGIAIAVWLGNSLRSWPAQVILTVSILAATAIPPALLEIIVTVRSGRNQNR
jgi:sterol desaturase/sphingolipid hydroxylase (fatty acid hydroxylase superfamily)